MFMKVGLSYPVLNSRPILEIVWSEMGPSISHVYIGKERDAFAEHLRA